FDFVGSEILMAQVATWPRIQQRFEQLRELADQWLSEEEVAPENRSYQCFIDARYVGQNFEVQVPMEDLGDGSLALFEAGFHEAHRKEYGYNVPTRQIEIINCRMKAVGAVSKAPLAKLEPGGTAQPDAERQIYF